MLAKIKGSGDGSRSLTVVKVVSPSPVLGPDFDEHILILTGKRKRPDVLSWSGSYEVGETGDYEVCCQGLYRGHYADAKVLASDLYRFLSENAPRQAVRFLQAWSAWVLG